MKFQLDTKAMEALFPEGSEARVELQTAVIANFAKRIKNDHISNLVKQEVIRETNGIADPRELGHLMNQALKAEFDNINRWGATVNLKTDSGIGQAMRSYVNTLQYEMIRNLRNEFQVVLKEGIEARAAGLIAQAKDELNKVEGELETRIRSNISRQMDDIIKQELKKALS